MEPDLVWFKEIKHQNKLSHMPVQAVANSYALNHATTPKAGKGFNFLLLSKCLADTPSSEFLVHKVPEADKFLWLLEESNIHGT